MINAYHQPHKVLHLRDPLLRLQFTNSPNPSTISLVDRHWVLLASGLWQNNFTRFPLPINIPLVNCQVASQLKESFFFAGFCFLSRPRATYVLAIFIAVYSRCPCWNAHGHNLIGFGTSKDYPNNQNNRLKKSCFSGLVCFAANVLPTRLRNLYP